MDNSNDFNEHWKVINSGSRVVSNTPEQLWNAAIAYFKWNEENPIKAKRTLTSGKTQGEKVEVEFKRPLSIKAFCLHANISERYLTDIKNTHDQNSEWYMVVEKILYIIYTQVLEGAVVDLYNPIMVSKILNLDKQDNNEQGPIRIEIVDSPKNKLANSENEVLQNLNLEKVQALKDKL